MDIWISYAAFDISTFGIVTYWSRDYVTISNSLMTFVLPIVIFIYKDLAYFHCLDIWFGYGYLNYKKKNKQTNKQTKTKQNKTKKKPNWFIIVDIWPGKPIYTPQQPW